MAEKALWQESDGQNCRCLLCPHRCLLKTGQTGLCGIRKKTENGLVTINYGMVSGIGLDPIEKKPLYHFHPGSAILSAGTFGCNFRCSFCQNWHISQKKPELCPVSPEQLLELFEKHGGTGIAYTYSEPAVWYEYILDSAPLIRNAGGKTVVVSNGFINPEPLKELIRCTDAFNIDLKAFSEQFYSEFCGGNLNAVLDSIRSIYGNSHLELTVLLVTGLNDSEREMEKMLDFITSVSDRIPLHISRYFPAYQCDRPATPMNKLINFYQMCRKRLKYVYLGNVSADGFSDTACPHCDKIVIRRHGYSVTVNAENGCCLECGKTLEDLVF